MRICAWMMLVPRGKRAKTPFSHIFAAIDRSKAQTDARIWGIGTCIFIHASSKFQAKATKKHDNSHAHARNIHSRRGTPRIPSRQERARKQHPSERGGPRKRACKSVTNTLLRVA